MLFVQAVCELKSIEQHTLLKNASHSIETANSNSQLGQNMCLCSVLSLIVLHVGVQFLCVIYHISLAHFYCRAPPHSAVADGDGLQGKGLPAAYPFSQLGCGVAESMLPKKPCVLT